MSIVPRSSVRFNVAVAVLVTIALSWVLSTGLANYMNYRSMVALRQQMLARPKTYPYPIPEPQFGISDFLLGRPPRAANEGGQPPPGPPPDERAPAGPPAIAPRLDRPPPPRDPPPPGVFSPLEIRWVLLRLLIATGLAALAAVWVGRKLTGPLSELADGAHAFHARKFDYRIPLKGKSEFTAVATAMNEMADEVSRHIHKLEQDADRRRQFLADVAHELRSPITTIRTMAGALQDGVAKEPDRQAQAVSALVRTSERMLRLVQDVMELVELDLDTLPVTKTQVDLSELIALVTASLEEDAAKASIELKPLEKGPAVNASVDPDRIAQVVDNVIGNAISHAGTGASVRVTIEDGDPVRISVVDTGIGIPARDLASVTEPFYRVSSSRTPGENHIGLGLSIARRILEAHGGSIGVSSEEGKGTRVVMTVPKGTG